jgi:hypothetical protein
MLDPVTARYHVERDHAVETMLRRMASGIRRRPDRAEYGVGGRYGQFRITIGADRLEMPIIGTWPLDDLTPRGVAGMLEGLADDASLPSSCQSALEAYATEALCVAIARDALDEEAIRDGAGGLNAEVCFDEGTHEPFLWIATGDPDDVQWERLKADNDLIAAPYVVPCHFFERKRSDGSKAFVMTESCSDSEGIAIPSLKADADLLFEVAARIDGTIDPVSLLRMYARATRPTVSMIGHAA